MTHRPTVYGTRHAISAGHYLAASAGFSILEAGGNAIDAGVAAGIALGVLQPDLVNFAGVAPILIRLADGSFESIAGLGWWPKTIPADLFMREHGGENSRWGAAHRGAGRSRRVDHRTAAAWNDAVRGCGCLGDPVRG
jgi:gamma-glutamyltranspeptidase